VIILDAEVVPRLMNHNLSSTLVDWVAGQAAPEFYLSRFDETELPECAELQSTGGRRDSLLAAVEGMLREDSDGFIIALAVQQPTP